MSIKDYTKYAKATEPTVEPVVEAPVETPVEPVVEVAAEPVNEPEAVDNLPTPDAEPEKCDEVRTGRVFGCAKLNVRKEPKANADILCTIPCHTEIEINVDKSTDDFYKVYTASGVEGFCMKTYIIMN